eukprot:s4626_g1.t1
MAPQARAAGEEGVVATRGPGGQMMLSAEGPRATAEARLRARCLVGSAEASGRSARGVGMGGMLAVRLCLWFTMSTAAGSAKPLAIVTGANTGIGFHTAESLAERGFHVILACRSLERGADALAAAQGKGSAELRRLDLSSFASVQAFAADLEGPVDLLVCNAGLNSASANQEPEGQLSEDQVDVLYQTNYLSHFLLTLLLLPLLRPVARLMTGVSLDGTDVFAAVKRAFLASQVPSLAKNESVVKWMHVLGALEEQDPLQSKLLAAEAWEALAAQVSDELEINDGLCDTNATVVEGRNDGFYEVELPNLPSLLLLWLQTVHFVNALDDQPDRWLRSDSCGACAGQLYRWLQILEKHLELSPTLGRYGPSGDSSQLRSRHVARIHERMRDLI